MLCVNLFMAIDGFLLLIRRCGSCETQTEKKKKSAPIDLHIVE